jgi:hypothetical protein
MAELRRFGPAGSNSKSKSPSSDVIECFFWAPSSNTTRHGPPTNTDPTFLSTLRMEPSSTTRVNFGEPDVPCAACTTPGLPTTALDDPERRQPPPCAGQPAHPISPQDSRRGPKHLHHWGNSCACGDEVCGDLGRSQDDDLRWPPGDPQFSRSSAALSESPWRSMAPLSGHMCRPECRLFVRPLGSAQCSTRRAGHTLLLANLMRAPAFPPQTQIPWWSVRLPFLRTQTTSKAL